ncbi:MAG: VWA-like domain-containing protein [Myxococcota bacterium]|nr:VWA-like domain-containing protein [Myxococcota bacterium]
MFVNPSEEQLKRRERTLDEVGRCLNHMFLGLFSMERAEPLHSQVLQFLPKRVTDTDTPSIALSLRNDGLFLLINHDYFFHTLTSTEERCAALRHEENYLFLHLPFRAQKYREQLFQNRLRESTFDESRDIDWDFSLFKMLAYIESSQFIRGYAPLKDAVRLSDYPDLKIPPASSTEQMYSMLYPYWRTMCDTIERAPNFSGVPDRSIVVSLYRMFQQTSHSDTQHWDGEQSYDTHGNPVSKRNLVDHDYDLLEKEVQRILVSAREALPLDAIEGIDDDVHRQFDGYLAQRNLKRTDPVVAKAADKELSRIINRFFLKDPFFAHFLMGCVRKMTDTISTAGVALFRKYIVLFINPDFFMNQLKNTAERGAVLKHEALHIILKHVIQMRNPRFPNKRLYNIAADLEVNQMIGGNWILPSGALQIDKPPFSNMELPANDVAETYYKLLNQVLDTNHSEKHALRDILQEDGSVGGHSDHRGWESPKGSTGEGAGSDTGEPNDYWGSIHGAKGFDIDAHERGIERTCKEAVDALGSRAGNLPGRLRDLFKKWEQIRQPRIDWKRELRLFVSANPSTTLKRSMRKKSKRYFDRIRQSLAIKPLTADVIHALARAYPQKLPSIRWCELERSLQNDIRRVFPKIDTFDLQVPLPLQQLSYFVVHQLCVRHPVDWPSWSDVPDSILKRLKLYRVPLDPTMVPIEVILSLRTHYPKMLPQLSWDEHFGRAEQRRIQKEHRHIQWPLWSVLPAEELLKLQQRHPELFQMTWEELPVDFRARFTYIDFSGAQPFRVDRILLRPIPGLKKERDKPTILIIIDTSGSMSDTDIEYVFAEVDGIYRLGCEVHILQADTAPQLYYKYNGDKPIAGRGGTSFDPALQWANDARNGVRLATKIGGDVSEQDIQLHVDGIVYLTDGYASTPNVKPYCRILWVLTPDGTDRGLRRSEHPGEILRLPPYEGR